MTVFRRWVKEFYPNDMRYLDDIPEAYLVNLYPDLAAFGPAHEEIKVMGHIIWDMDVNHYQKLNEFVVKLDVWNKAGSNINYHHFIRGVNKNMELAESLTKYQKQVQGQDTWKLLSDAAFDLSFTLSHAYTARKIGSKKYARKSHYIITLWEKFAISLGYSLGGRVQQ